MDRLLARIIGGSAISAPALAFTLFTVFGINAIATRLKVIRDPNMRTETKIASVTLLILQGYFDIQSSAKT